jgi:hypothetical protein
MCHFEVAVRGVKVADEGASPSTPMAGDEYVPTLPPLSIVVMVAAVQVMFEQ